MYCQYVDGSGGEPKTRDGRDGRFRFDEELRALSSAEAINVLLIKLS